MAMRCLSGVQSAQAPHSETTPRRLFARIEAPWAIVMALFITGSSSTKADEPTKPGMFRGMLRRPEHDLREAPTASEPHRGLQPESDTRVASLDHVFRQELS